MSIQLINIFKIQFKTSHKPEEYYYLINPKIDAYFHLIHLILIINKYHNLLMLLII